MLNWVEACLLVGFFGDAGLQTLDRGTWGLTGYFAQHGRAESLFVAAGMMGVFGGVYQAAGFPLAVLPLFLYGAALDLVFRYSGVVGSLSGYYATLSVPLTLLWGGLPFFFALALVQYFSF